MEVLLLMKANNSKNTPAIQAGLIMSYFYARLDYYCKQSIKAFCWTSYVQYSNSSIEKVYHLAFFVSLGYLIGRAGQRVWYTPDLRGTERVVRYRLLKLRAPRCQNHVYLYSTIIVNTKTQII